MFNKIFQVIMQLFVDSVDGRLSNKKIGEVVVGMTFTYKMVRDMPDSPELWLTYAGVVLGWSTASYALKHTVGKSKPTIPEGDK